MVAEPLEKGLGEDIEKGKAGPLYTNRDTCSAISKMGLDLKNGAPQNPILNHC